MTQRPAVSTPPVPGLGLSRAAVARNLGLSEATVARIERTALLKARAELERRGLCSARQLLALLSPSHPTDDR